MMTKLAMHFNDQAHQVIDNVTAFWVDEKHVHVRTLFDDYPVEHSFNRKNIRLVFEVKDDDSKKRII